MKKAVLTVAALSVLAIAPLANAFNIITPGDPIIAIDFDFSSNSDSPGAEGPGNLLDGDSGTKYLNFGKERSGFIVTPGASILQSFQLTTANDAPERDPASYIVFGTNDPITSAIHSDGLAENWTEISMGDFVLTDDRQAAGPVIGFSNATSYSSYKMFFPTLKNSGAANSMQLADVDFFSSIDGSAGTSILAAGNPIIAIQDPTFDSNFPGAEGPDNAIDRDATTKYLNFGDERSGFIVTPSAGPQVVEGFRITTANDFPERDPATWEIYGTNDAIVSAQNSTGDGENWTLIDSGAVTLPAERDTVGPLVPITNNSGAFTSYRVVFPTLKDAADGSMQIAEFELFAPDDGVLEINRQTGEVRIEAVENITFESYEVRSPNAGALDAAEWTSIASEGADANDTWTETSAAPGLLAEEDAAGGADDGFSLTSGNGYSLGNVWLPVPSQFEDAQVSVIGTDGLPLGVGVEYVGAEIPIGDYSGNGSVGIEDWPMFRAGYGGDNTGMSLLESYFASDLDGDFDSDIADFNIFVASAGGAAVLFGVPEPASAVFLFALVGLGAATLRRPGRAVGLACVCGIALSLLPAKDTAAQTFVNVGGVPSGITIPAGQENEGDDTGPENLFDDTFLDDIGIINEELFVLDYNDPDLMGGPFLQYAGLGPDPKVVFLDYGSSVTANWFAYSQRSGGDPTADRVGTFEFWFSNTDFGGALPGGDPDATFELRPTDDRLLDSTLRPYSLGGDQTGRYVALRLTVSELSANQPTNNIGGHEFRLLDGPSDVVLEVDRGTGDLTLRNNGPGAQSISMKSYTIESAGGALDPGGFDGLGGETGFPLGNGTGNGWEIGGGSNANRLAEGYFSSQSMLSAGESGLGLGAAYLPIAEDLVFKWTNADGNVFDALVQYVGDLPFLKGDTNNDGIVNTLDIDPFVLALTDPSGYAAAFPGVDINAVADINMDGDVNTLDIDPFVILLTGGGAATIPEPSSLAVALACLLGITTRGRAERVRAS